MYGQAKSYLINMYYNTPEQFERFIRSKYTRLSQPFVQEPEWFAHVPGFLEAHAGSSTSGSNVNKYTTEETVQPWVADLLRPSLETLATEPTTSTEELFISIDNDIEIVLAANGCGKYNTFLIDSGLTCQISNSLEGMLDVKRFSKSVVVDDHKRLDATHIGSMILVTDKGT